MPEQCTSNGGCVAGFMDCEPCPFDQKDYFNGDIDSLDPIIRAALGSDKPIAEVAEEFDDLITADEIVSVMVAVKAKRAASLQY